MSSVEMRRLGYCAQGRMDGAKYMQRVDGAYLYELGATIRPVLELKDEDIPIVNLFFTLSPIRNAVNNFVFSSIFSGSLKTVLNSANELLRAIDEITPLPTTGTDWAAIIAGWRVSNLKAVFRRFEAILMAELQIFALYHVAPKGGLDTMCLTDRGQALFPEKLPQKAPEALEDTIVGARCMAFGLWTAMAFHFHRANEAVLRRYYASVIGNNKQPKYLTIGTMVKSMADHGVGDVNIRAALDNIREFHRNPIAHPDQNLENEEQALSLYSAVRAAMGYMLDKLPLVVTPPPLTIPLPPLQLTP